MDAALAREAAALYELPAAEYTKARNERAKKLRLDDPDLADEVAKLPKPTAAAAAVNRLARREPSEVRALIQAGKRLRDAQERAVGGRAGGELLQEAIREHRAALERVQREARRLKLSEPVLERALATFRAASVDPDLQPLLQKGLLARDAEASGFALDPGLAVARRATKPVARAQARPKKAARAELKAARDRLADAKREAAAANRALKQAQRQADRAASRLREAEEAVAAAEAKLP